MVNVHTWTRTIFSVHVQCGYTFTNEVLVGEMSRPVCDYQGQPGTESGHHASPPPPTPNQCSAWLAPEIISNNWANWLAIWSQFMTAVEECLCDFNTVSMATSQPCMRHVVQMLRECLLQIVAHFSSLGSTALTHPLLDKPSMLFSIPHTFFSP